MAQVQFAPISASLLDATEDITLSSTGKQDQYPISLRLDTLNSIVNYRWTLSPVSTEHSGGIPTPRPSSIEVSRPFPAFEVWSVSGERRPLWKMKGTVSVINWWNTKCTPCLQEMPGLNKLVRKYGHRVSFIAVAPETQTEITKFLKTHAFDYVQTLTDTSGIAILGNAYPRNIIVDKSGIVVYDQRGGNPDTYKHIEATLLEHLSR